jgi:hypothetical protein
VCAIRVMRAWSVCDVGGERDVRKSGHIDGHHTHIRDPSSGRDAASLLVVGIALRLYSESSQGAAAANGASTATTARAGHVAQAAAAVAADVALRTLAIMCVARHIATEAEGREGG